MYSFQTPSGSKSGFVFVAKTVCRRSETIDRVPRASRWDDDNRQRWLGETIDTVIVLLPNLFFAIPTATVHIITIAIPLEMEDEEELILDELSRSCLFMTEQHSFIFDNIDSSLALSRDNTSVKYMVLYPFDVEAGNYELWDNVGLIGCCFRWSMLFSTKCCHRCLLWYLRGAVWVLRRSGYWSEHRWLRSLLLLAVLPPYSPSRHGKRYICLRRKRSALPPNCTRWIILPPQSAIKQSLGSWRLDDDSCTKYDD